MDNEARRKQDLLDIQRHGWANLRKWAKENKALSRQLRLKHPTIQDIRTQLIGKVKTFGDEHFPLSQKQCGLVLKLNNEANAVLPDDNRRPVEDSGDKRVTFNGEVIDRYTRTTQYGENPEMVLRVGNPEEGFYTLQGTIPKAALAIQKGDGVQLTARVKRSRDSGYVGYFNNPRLVEHVPIH